MPDRCFAPHLRRWRGPAVIFRAEGDVPCASLMSALRVEFQRMAAMSRPGAHAADVLVNPPGSHRRDALQSGSSSTDFGRSPRAHSGSPEFDLSADVRIPPGRRRSSRRLRCPEVAMFRSSPGQRIRLALPFAPAVRPRTGSTCRQRRPPAGSAAIIARPCRCLYSLTLGGDVQTGYSATRIVCGIAAGVHPNRKSFHLGELPDRAEYPPMGASR